jgi:hypothetical protein
MKTILTMMLVLSCIPAWAQVNVLSNKSNSKLSTMWDKFKEKSSMSFFSVYTGPGVQELGVNRINNEGEVEEDSYTRNWIQVSYRYQLTDTTRLVINPRFEVYHSSDAEEQYRLRSPVIGFTTTWWKSGDWSFTGGLNTIFLPTEKSTFEDKLLANPGGFNSLTYSGKNFNAGMWVWGRAYIHDSSVQAEKMDYELILSPFYEYKLTEKTILRGFVDTYYQQQAGRAFGHVNKTEDLTVGIGIDTPITKGIGIYPYLLVDATNRFSLDTTSIGAWIYGSIF